MVDPAAYATRINGRRTGTRRWPTWIFLIAFLLVSVESILIALVFKGTMLVLLAPGAICWVKAMELWKDLRRHLKLA